MCRGYRKMARSVSKKNKKMPMECFSLILSPLEKKEQKALTTHFTKPRLSRPAVCSLRINGRTDGRKVWQRNISSLEQTFGVTFCDFRVLCKRKQVKWQRGDSASGKLIVIHVLIHVNHLEGLRGEREIALLFLGWTILTRGWVLARVYVRVKGWVRDRGGYRGRVRGYVRF